MRSSTLVDWIGNAIALFVCSQVTVGAFYRIINASLERDYGVSSATHYVLAAVPVGLSVPIYVIVGASPLGPLFALALLGLAFRYTDDRPRGTLKTLSSLRARLAHGRGA